MREKKVFKTVWRSPIKSLKQWLKQLRDPLSAREQLLILLLLVFFALLVLNPFARADNENIGKLFLVPAQACQADDDWLNPGLASGLPQSNNQSAINQNNSAVAQETSSPLKCNGFIKDNDFSADNYALHISYSYQTLNQESLNQENNIDLVDKSSKIINSRSPISANNSKNINAIDGKLLVELSFDGGENFLSFHTIEQTNNTLSLAIPTIYNLQIEEMIVRLTPLKISDEKLLIESVGVSYEVTGEKEISAKLKNDSKNFVANNKLKFEITSKETTDGLWQGLQNKVSNDKKSLNIKAKIFDDKSNLIKNVNVKTTLKETNLENKSIFDAELIDMPKNLKPGNYSVVLEINDESGATNTYRQNFLWGVLASNFTRSTFTPEQTSQMQITVLDENGRTICDSNITVDITNAGQKIRSYSTSDGSINTGERCEEYGDHIEPDYFFDLSDFNPGDYEVKITADNPNGRYESFDNFSVKNTPDFTVERLTTTRVYPIVNYAMSINVSATNEDVYTVKDKVPKSFKIIQPKDAAEFSVTTQDDFKIIEWQILLNDEDKELRYIYDAPDISPAFYNIGELEITSDTHTYQENRTWQLAGDAIGRMILLFDGASVPAGWTCISCTVGDDFYQTFIRGNTTYGGTGGTPTHSHTASINIGTTTTPATAEDRNGSDIVAQSHTHSFTPTYSSDSNLPNYRNLKLIRYDTSGEPATLPAGVIGFFDSTVPSGWTQYSAQDGFYIRGENSIANGGSNTHSSTVTGTTGTPTDILYQSRVGGQQTTTSPGTHTHSVSLNTNTVNHEPPYIETILGKLDNSSSVPADLISMWDDSPPTGWLNSSGVGDAFHQRFIKPSTSYGATGGSETHSHTDINSTTGIGSASISARPGTFGSSPDHDHPIDATNFSTETHLPPYRDVVLAKKAAGSTFEQTSYRFYQNSNTTDVGDPLASQNTTANLTNKGEVFRLRSLIHVGNQNLNASGETFKLQYSEMSGSCDTNFIGENFVDVTTNSGPIRYYDNPSPTDDSGLTANVNDPTHSTDTVVNQTYQEANNFTNSSTINSGQDGMWDFSLYDHSAAGLTSYCFRMVKSSGDTFNTYTNIPQITTAEPPAQMVLLFDGATTPSGWSCISCAPGDDAYQRFLRGEANYGGQGGSQNHTPTATTSVLATTTPQNGATQNSTSLHDNTHAHSLTPAFSQASNLPQYRSLKIIRYDNGSPSTIPSGAIALFSGAIPAGWTQYSAQNGNYVYGENSVTTGGSNTHNHTVSGTTGGSTGTEFLARNGSQQIVATAGHTHEINGNTDTLSHEPPFIETKLAMANSDTALPDNFIAMWTKAAPGGWNCVSCTTGDAFYQRFFKPAATHGATGGSVSHTHADQTITSSAPSSTTSTRNGTDVSDSIHTHDVSITNYSTDNNLPPYLNVIIASRGVNNPPDDPVNLTQKRTSAGTAISTGGWANETQVTFQADASDTDNPDDLQLCVEVKPIGTAFTDTEDTCGFATTYSGSAISVSVDATGLTDTEEYHWQARTKDAGGVYSSWVSYGANPESERDFAIDATAPTGNVYDGSTTGVDIDFNGGSLSQLSGNWNIDSSISGLNSYEYSIGTSAGSDDVFNWTSTASTSFTESSLNINTSQLYYVNVRTTDNAGNQSIISSDGIFVSPTLTFSTSTTQVQFNNLNQSNSFSDEQSSTLTTSTNAYNGYEIRAYVDSLLSFETNTIPMFGGGTYSAPSEWAAGLYGFGYHSSDTLVNGANRFNSTPCAGGGNPPCYAPFSLSAPGDIIADNTNSITGSPIINEEFTITHKVATDTAQQSGVYKTVLIYTITARY